MSVNQKTLSYDVVVIGGGLSGVCAAVACARHGVKTALLQNRPMFGGNASSEIRMHIVGASAHASKKNMAETGILMEILMENKRRNPYASFSVFDTIIWEKVHMQENLDSFLNTNVDDLVMENGKIARVIGHQATTETELTISGKLFIDATGHGTIGVMAGAESRMGSEGREEFGEAHAPEQPNHYMMGDTLLFSAVDRGEPVRFIKPEWAYTFTEEQLRFRHHDNSITSHKDGGETVAMEENANRLPHFSNIDSGYWWIELGGDSANIITESEHLRDELLKCVYGVWDHLKNQGDHGAENLDLDWVGIIPGHRESRRLVGDYLLNENDVVANRVFDDAVAYGGWAMDVHTPGGLRDFDRQPSNIINFEGIYTIPYRCYYSCNVENLMMCGRDISVTKMAYSSSRVMGTCAVGGQAVGTAAAIAIREGCTPREVGWRHIRELQQTLLRDDCYIPGVPHAEEGDLARRAQITATGSAPGCGPENVINGIARPVGDRQNCWQSAKLGDSLTLFFPAAAVSQVRLTFDPDLTREMMPSLTRIVRDRQYKGLAPQLVRDFTVEYLLNGQTMQSQTVTDNARRLCVLSLEAPITCDTVRITINGTYGEKFGRIYEVGIY